jgi:hypothetical protein
LLPFSGNKGNVKKALEEGLFSGEIIDHEMPLETCEVHQKDDRRYHFQISNKLNRTLWVESK